jgi:hypothetical protein
MTRSVRTCDLRVCLVVGLASTLIGCSLEERGLGPNATRDPGKTPDINVDAPAELSVDASVPSVEDTPAADTAVGHGSVADAAVANAVVADAALADASVADASGADAAFADAAVADAAFADAGVEDADADAADADAAVAPIPMVPDATTGCALSGTRALRITAKVNWKGSALLDIVPLIVAGSGEVQVVVLLDVKGDGNEGQATIRACGAALPPFQSSVREHYRVRFDEALWEAVATRWKTSFSRSCAEPGCAVTASYVEAQLGVELPQHFNWPGPRDALAKTYLRDDDGDGASGIPVVFDTSNDTGVSYENPPTSILAGERSKQANLGLRVTLSLDGKLESCQRYAGRTRSMTIDTRAHGCVLESGEPCTGQQVSFVNDNLPVWEVQGASWQMVELPAGASCAMARAALL